MMRVVGVGRLEIAFRPYNAMYTPGGEILAELPIPSNAATSTQLTPPRLQRPIAPPIRAIRISACLRSAPAKPD